MIVYVGLAVITTFLAQLEHLNSDEVPEWTWIGWARFSGYMLLAAFTTFKAYVSRPPVAATEPEPSTVSLNTLQSVPAKP
jgi:hypothetical protein